FGSFIQVYVDDNSFPFEEIMWPKLAVGYSSIAHVLANNNPGVDIEKTAYYSRSYSDNYGYDGFLNWDLLEETQQRQRLLSYGLDASKTGTKVVRVHLLGPDDSDSDETIQFQETNDVYIRQSTDAGTTWGDLINITNYNQIDNGEVEYLAQAPYDDPNNDYTYYWQAGHNVEVHIDNYDVTHVIWTTLMFPVSNDIVFYPVHVGNIYHWDDLTEQISLVYDDLSGNPLLDVGPVELADRLGAFKTSSSAPTMAHDEANNLYIVFSKFFADDYCAYDPGYGNDSNGLMYNGEIMAIGSIDGGLTWGSVN
ncbi:MAG: hypothetical protein GY869_27500, partial [Planctomycetes bacterium]|nr:hypothetical protein [Planctomycetota bacterium]